MPQPGFFDLDERYTKLNERDPLVKLNQIIDWEAFREALFVLRNPPRKSQAGRKPVVMPAHAGKYYKNHWIPACAGMTGGTAVRHLSGMAKGRSEWQPACFLLVVIPAKAGILEGRPGR